MRKPPVSNWVLDASAVLALLQAEPGADRVAAVLGGAVISAVNWTEVAGKLTLAGMPPARAASTVDALPVAVYPFTREHGVLASELAPASLRFGLSLGDRACLGLARSTGRPVMTADRAWEGIDFGVAIELIR